MANIKELRGRISSVTNIAKITKAMEMVASMKLRKVQNKALAFRPYTDELCSLMAHLAESVGESANVPLFRRREVKTRALLVMSADRGLCGAYNTNALAQVHEFERGLPAGVDAKQSTKFYVYGKKGYTYLSRRGYQVERFYAEPTLDKLDFKAAQVIAKDLVDAFDAGEIDEVRVVYTAFVTASRFKPTTKEFLPVTDAMVEGADRGDDSRHKTDFLLEPSAVKIFNRIVPRYLETVIFDAMTESLAAEHASRRMAMKGATDAASRMSKDLRKVYNRARQESITKELLDIIGGTNAVS